MKHLDEVVRPSELAEPRQQAHKFKLTHRQRTYMQNYMRRRRAQERAGLRPSKLKIVKPTPPTTAEVAAYRRAAAWCDANVTLDTLPVVVLTSEIKIPRDPKIRHSQYSRIAGKRLRDLGLIRFPQQQRHRDGLSSLWCRPSDLAAVKIMSPTQRVIAAGGRPAPLKYPAQNCPIWGTAFDGPLCDGVLRWRPCTARELATPRGATG